MEKNKQQIQMITYLIDTYHDYAVSIWCGMLMMMLIVYGVGNFIGSLSYSSWVSLTIVGIGFIVSIPLFRWKLRLERKLKYIKNDLNKMFEAKE